MKLMIASDIHGSAFYCEQMLEALVHYYAKFGFVNEGISGSTHGGVVWYQMRLKF